MCCLSTRRRGRAARLPLMQAALPPLAAAHALTFSSHPISLPASSLAQLEGAVHAIVTMQPLPTASAGASPAPPSSPRAAAAPAAAEHREWQEGGAAAAAEAAEAGSDDGGSYRSAASDLLQSQSYLSAGSGSPLSRSNSSSSSPGESGGSGSSSGSTSPVQEVQPSVPPPPRPGATPDSGPAAAQPQQQPPSQSSQEEGVHAPPPTPAGSAAPSAAPSPAVSPRRVKQSAAPPPPAGAAAGGLSAPASPATPFAAQQARPSWQPDQRRQQGGEPGSPGEQGGSLPGSESPSPTRQAPQGSWVPQRRSRLAVTDAAGPRPAEQPASVHWAAAAAPAAAPAPPTKGLPASGSASRHLPPASAASAVAAPEPSAAVETAASRVGPGQQLTRASTGSSDEPQLTEVRGPWPPPPLASQQQQQQQQQQPREPQAAEPSTALSPAAAQPREQSDQQQRSVQPRSPSWAGGLASAFYQASTSALPRSPEWRPRDDDGSWEQHGAAVDWGGGAAPPRPPPGPLAGRPWVAAEGSSDEEPLLHDSLVDAAAHSPPLSPTTTRLLALKHPSSELQRGTQRRSVEFVRGPQRAASLAPGLAHHPPERQPSLLSPEPRQHSGRLQSAHTSPMAAGGPRPGSSPLVLPPPDSGGSQAGGTSGVSAASLGRRSVSEQAPQRQLQRAQRMLPVLNASPDVAASGSLPAPPSPFHAPAPAASAPLAAEAPADGSGSGDAGSGAFGGLGGLPLEVVEKREHRRGSGADLSPREVRHVGGLHSWADGSRRLVRGLTRRSAPAAAGALAREWDPRPRPHSLNKHPCRPTPAEGRETPCGSRSWARPARRAWRPARPAPPTSRRARAAAAGAARSAGCAGAAAPPC